MSRLVPGAPRERHLETAYEFVASAIVRAATAEGVATLEDFLVHTYVRREKGHPRRVLENAFVRVRRTTQGKGGTSGEVEIPHRELSDGDRSHLRGILGVNTPAITDDDWAGPVRAQPVGQSWPINVEVAVDWFERMNGLTFPNDGISGETVIEGVEAVDGVECLRLRTLLVVEGATPPSVPDTMTFERAGGELLITGAYPIDPTVGVLYRRERFSVEVRARGRQGTVLVEETRHSDTEYSYRRSR